MLKRILIVDDEPIVGFTISRLLEAAGFQVTFVPQGIDALKEVEASLSANNEFQLAIVDFSLRDMKGDELARRISTLDSALPVVVATGDANASVLRDPRAAGFSGAIQKPFGRTQLLAAVGAYIRVPAGGGG